MIILALDTSTRTASAALVEDGRLIHEEIRGAAEGSTSGLRPLTGRTNHGETLLPLVESLLKNSSCSWEKIGAMGISIGPGSFTGLRIGLSTVKGLAYGWDVPVVGIPTLLAITHRVTDWNGLICPMSDARKKEVYTALFRADDNGRVIRLTEDLVCRPTQILQQSRSLGAESCLFIGDGVGLYDSLIQEFWGGQGKMAHEDHYPSTAYAVALLGAERVKKGETDRLDVLAPLYLRPSEAEVSKKAARGDPIEHRGGAR